MTSKQPPRIAAWMLKHFGSGANVEAVLGDLAEQYVQKPSVMRYWRQAMKAIPVSLFWEIRAHKKFAAKALLIGWAAWILGGLMIFPLVFWGTNIGYFFEPRHPVGSAWSFMWMPVLGPAGLQPSVSVAFATALPFVLGIICGWLVARWRIRAQGHPPAIRLSRVPPGRKTGAVLLFAGSILLIDLLLLGPFILQLGPSAASRFIAPLAANFAASVLGILLGGGLFRENSTTLELDIPDLGATNG